MHLRISVASDLSPSYMDHGLKHRVLIHITKLIHLAYFPQYLILAAADSDLIETT